MVILLFGASGGAGGGVLAACLEDPAVTEIRAIVRRPLSIADPKLHEFIHADFTDFSPVKSAFANVVACFYCVGISTTQVAGEAQYRMITSVYAMAAAATLHRESPKAVFHFISGEGASLSSRFMWARVKAETERDLLASGPTVCYRPAYIDSRGSASEPMLYKVLRPAFSLALRPFPQVYVKAVDIGRAMLSAARSGLMGEIVDNSRIHELAAASGRQ
jgi:uncharacterized protein YbjT (DUF2867 family)